MTDMDIRAKKHKVLIVERDDARRLLYEKSLKEKGHDVCSCRLYREALKLLENDHKIVEVCLHSQLMNVGPAKIEMRLLSKERAQ